MLILMEQKQDAESVVTELETTREQTRKAKDLAKTLSTETDIDKLKEMQTQATEVYEKAAKDAAAAKK
jgi:hypothetical protein